MKTTGNIALLELPKTAFLCSRKIPASVILKCYDWAIAQRNAGVCVMSGFHSQIEKDVLYYLLKGTQPIILVLARGLKTRVEAELKKPLAEDRLLIISPFEESVKQVSTKTSQIRNKLMIALADSITVGYASAGGQLATVLEGIEKPINNLYE